MKSKEKIFMEDLSLFAPIILLTIFLVKPTLPENFEDETWQKLRQAIHAIYEKQAITSSLEELYKVNNTANNSIAMLNVHVPHSH